MEIVKAHQKRTLTPTPSLTVHEYDMHESAIGGGIALLQGRYPEKGYVKNTETKELVYILSGNGKWLSPEQEIQLAAGDMILIAPHDLYAWEGNMSLHMSNTPKFNPDQHKLATSY